MPLPTDTRQRRLDTVRSLLQDRATRDSRPTPDHEPIPSDRRALWQERLAAFTRARPPAPRR